MQNALHSVPHMEVCSKWIVLSSFSLFSASPHTERLILATVSIRVLAGNRWHLPVKDSFRKGCLEQRGQDSGSQQGMVKHFRISNNREVSPVLDLKGQGGELPKLKGQLQRSRILQWRSGAWRKKGERQPHPFSPPTFCLLLKPPNSQAQGSLRRSPRAGYNRA